MSLLLDEGDSGSLKSKRLKNYQCAKAIIAVCDFALLSDSAYTPLVNDKATNISSDCKDRTSEFLSRHLARL